MGTETSARAVVGRRTDRVDLDRESVVCERGRARGLSALLACGATFLLSASVLLGQVAEDEKEFEDLVDLPLEELIYVDIASGFRSPLAQAPAVASVITAEDIEAMGARHLAEVLEMVPGLHVVPSTERPLDPVFSIRGIHSQSNAQVLTLIDGVRAESALIGGPIFPVRFPVSSIARIEVIRGPGSALYGADAFAGVINIVTKGAEDFVDGRGQAGVRLGSFGSRDLWATDTLRMAGWDLTWGFEWQESDGDSDRVIDVDSQSGLDALLGTNASLAPGPLDTEYEILDFHLGLERDRWRIKLWSWLQNDRGVGAGAAQALDPEGGIDSTHALFDLEYTNRERFAGWEVGGRFSFVYLDQLQEGDLRIFPRGSLLPIGPDGNVSFLPGARFVLFPDGFIGNPEQYERTTTLEVWALETDEAGAHRLRIGAGMVRHTLDTGETLNFGPGVIDGSEGIVDGTLSDITDTPSIFIADQERDQWFFNLQDIWTLGESWQLTTGVRYDEYSDFGGTFNPRLALVWSGEMTSAKLLVGTAYRAPSFVELFIRNNPVQLGNRELDPETITTFELAVDHRTKNGLRIAASVFSYEIDDLIDLVPDLDAPTITFRNSGEQEGYGFEIEADWRANDTFRLRGHYSWQDSEDAQTGAAVPFGPGQKLWLASDWRFAENWCLGTRTLWVGDRRRGFGDPRPAPDDYLWVDLTLRRKRLADHWDFALGVRNVFDEDAREPSQIELPGDYPLPSRDAFVELRRRF